MSTTELPKNVSKVPSISELVRDINYGGERKTKWDSLLTHLQSFREGYKTSSGTPGSDFVDWKNPMHKSKLRIMAQIYLKDGEGAQFWPEDEASPYYNGLRYSKDREHITLVLVQLFFRLNKQQHLHIQQKPIKKVEEPRAPVEDAGGSPSAEVSPSKSRAEKPASAVSSPSTPKRNIAAGRYSNTKETPIIDLTPSSRSHRGREVDQAMTTTRTAPVGQKRVLLPRPDQGNTSTDPPAAPSVTRRDQNGEPPAQQGSGKKRFREEPTVSCPGRNPPRKRKAPDRTAYATTYQEISEACSPAPSDAQPDPLPNVETAQQQTTITREPSPPGQPHPRLQLNVDTSVNQASPQAPREIIDSSELENRTTPFGAPPPRIPLTALPDIPSGSPPTTSRRALEEIMGWRPGMRTPDGCEAGFPGLRPNPTDRFNDAVNLMGKEGLPPSRIGLSGVKHSAIVPDSAPMAVMGPDTTETNAEDSAAQSGALREYLERNHTLRGFHYDSTASTGDHRKDNEPAPQTPTNKAADQTVSPHRTSEPRTPVPSAQVVKYVLVHSRSPRWQAEFWTPKGKFMKKSLPELMDELPQAFVHTAKDAPGLMFRMIGASSREERPIAHGDDDEFDSMKLHTLKAAFTKHRRAAMNRGEQVERGGPAFRIEIEALGDDFIAEPGDLTKEMEDDDIF